MNEMSRVDLMNLLQRMQACCQWRKRRPGLAAGPLVLRGSKAKTSKRIFRPLHAKLAFNLDAACAFIGPAIRIWGI